MNVYFRLLILSLLGLTSTSAFAQDPCEDFDLVLTLSDPYTADGSPIEPGDAFCIDFNVTGFIDVAVINFIVSFDPSVIEPTTAGGGNIPSNSELMKDFEYINFFNDIGYLSYIWSSPTASGITINDGTLFKMSFIAVGDVNDCTLLDLVLNPTIGSPPVSGINADPTQPTIECDFAFVPNEVCLACSGLNVIANSCSTTGADGSITFGFCGGIAPYTYEILDPSGSPIDNGNLIDDNDTQTISGLSSGAYTINVMDAAGTTSQLMETINLGDPLSFDLTVVRPPACPGSRGEIGISNVAGGFGNPDNFQIQWSNGTFTQDSIEVVSGVYDVTITDEAGCEASQSITMIVEEIELENINITPSTCGGADGGVSFEITGGTSTLPIDYEILIKGIPSGNGTPYSNNQLDAGICDIVIRDENGCLSDTFFITIPSLNVLDIDITPESVDCFGDTNGSVMINVGESLGFDINNPFTFNTLLNCANGQPAEDENGDDIICGVNQNGGSIFCNGNIPPGTFCITILTDSGCTRDTSFTIEEPMPLSFVKDSINPDCTVASGEASLIVSGGTMPYGYQWSHDASLNDPTASMLDPGQFFVTITDDNGCSTQANFNIEGGTQLTVDIQIIESPNCDLSVLGIASADVQGNPPGLAYQWFDESNALISVQQEAMNLAPGTYTVEVTDDQTGCSGTDTIIVEPVAPFVFDATITNTNCFNSSDGAILIECPTGGVEPYIFNWADFGPIGKFASALSPGFYEVTITDATDCSKDTIFEVTAPTEVTGVFTNIDSTTCYDSCDGAASIQGIAGTITTGTYSYSWSTGETGDSISDLCPGIYSVTVFDENLCASEEILFEIERPDSLELVIDPLLTIDINCSGDTNGMVAVQANGGTGDYVSYQWTNNISNTTFASELSEGTYGITVTDSNGCQADTQYSLTTSPPITGEVFISEEVQCFGGRATICVRNVSGGSMSSNAEYLYNVGINLASNIPIDSCVQFPVGEYTVNIFDTAGGAGSCSFDTQIVIDQPDQINVQLGDDRSITLGDSTTFISSTVTGGTPIDTFIWESDLGVVNFECRDDDCSSIFIYPDNSTTYTLTVIDENGCLQDASVFVEVLKERRVYRPNVFYPRSISGNDRYMIFVGDGTEAIDEFSIYDRWGNQVFLLENVSSSDVTPELGWDGRINGEDAESGVYAYVASIRFIDSDEPVIYRGQFTLIR